MNNIENSSDKFLKKAMNYCAYQERCVFDIEKKFNEWQVPYDWRALIIKILKNDNFINEQRFAESFVRAKFGQKKWGKIKITQYLNQKKISSKNIAIALQQINEVEYEGTIKQLVDKKLEEVRFKSKNKHEAFYKVSRFMYQKGYDNNDVWKYLNKAK